MDDRKKLENALEALRRIADPARAFREALSTGSVLTPDEIERVGAKLSDDPVYLRAVAADALEAMGEQHYNQRGES